MDINIGIDRCVENEFKLNSANMIWRNIGLGHNDNVKVATAKIGNRFGF